MVVWRKTHQTSVPDKIDVRIKNAVNIAFSRSGDSVPDGNEMMPITVDDVNGPVRIVISGTCPTNRKGFGKVAAMTPNLPADAILAALKDEKIPRTRQSLSPESD